ncbi:MAG: GyrI-like domain-containing protein [Treponema sp.]|nr:GyrI-like domain-containing protein [Treponema sp.]
MNKKCFGVILVFFVCAIISCVNTQEIKNGKENKMDEVKIVSMFPARTVAYHIVDTEPEGKALEPILKWITENNLVGTMRLFGFNTEPYPSGSNSAYGFGFCATIPEGSEIPSPLYEKRLPGGIYAVLYEYEGHPGFGWEKMGNWQNDPNWEWMYDNSRPGLEEHIPIGDKDGYFIPILLPVKKK